MIRVLTKCPVCNGKLKAVKLSCQSCGTVIENTFDFPPLLGLSREQLEFVEVFIKSRGNIKDVEKELSISYPTVRAKLDQVIEALEGNQPQTKKAAAKTEKQKEIINALERGEISPEEALELLK
jgi:hypothetical protein